MNPQDQNQTPPQVNNPLSVMQQGERNIFEVRRHPIGIIGTFIGAGVLIIVAALVAFVVVPMVVTDNHSRAMEIGALGFLIITVVTLLFVLIANKVYWGNRWILTSDSLTQVLQRSLFDKQSSQLSLANLEDVSAQQDGIIAHMFNYGAIKVETAGERSKFIFAYCPKPNYYAQEILRARELFEQDRRSLNQPVYMAPAQSVPPAAYQASPPVTNPSPPTDDPGASGVNVNSEQ